MSNYPAGVTTSSLPGERGHYPKRDVCCVCAREMEYVYYPGLLSEWQFVETCRVADYMSVGNYAVCGQRCKSQYVWNTADPSDRQLLKALAMVVCLWTESTSTDSQKWLLEHSHLSKIINPLSLRMIDTELRELQQALGADDDDPQWYIDATQEVYAR